MTGMPGEMETPRITLKGAHAVRWLDCQRRAAFLERERRAVQGVPASRVLKEWTLADLQGRIYDKPNPSFRITYDTVVRSERELVSLKNDAVIKAQTKLADSGVLLKPGTRSLEWTDPRWPGGFTIVSEPDLEGVLSSDGREILILVEIDDRRPVTVPELACLWVCMGTNVAESTLIATLTLPSPSWIHGAPPQAKLKIHEQFERDRWNEVYQQISAARLYSDDHQPLANPSSHSCWTCLHPGCGYQQIRKRESDANVHPK